VRERRDLRRQAEVRERVGDVCLPGAGAHDALAEAIRLSELEADLVHRLIVAFGRGFAAEERADARLLLRSGPAPRL